MATRELWNGNLRVLRGARSLKLGERPAIPLQLNFGKANEIEGPLISQDDDRELPQEDLTL